MKFVPNMVAQKALWFLCVLCACAVHTFCLDREAFSIVHYDLDVQVEPQQHRLAARGTILLRNDSGVPQKVAVLQISSSLDWRSIKLGDKPLQFVRQPLTSDIDHTGSLSEAIVTFPKEIAPHAAVGLEIAYEGVVLLDATRLTRIGAPEDAAKSTDWDQVDANFSGVRGIGHVAWYPIATDVANLSEGDSLFQALARWKLRESGATARLVINVWRDREGPPASLLANDASCARVLKEDGETQLLMADCNFRSPGTVVPSFVVGLYGEVDRSSIQVFNLGGHAAAAESYANAAEKVSPLITDWFGAAREKPVTADIPDSSAAPFESGAFRITPLGTGDSKLLGLTAAHQLTHASFSSPRTWINEGLAHFGQAVYLEQEKGRQAAVDYLEAHRSALNTAEADASSSTDDESRSLVKSANEEFVRSKAICVWWMLRDMVGDASLKKVIAAYKPDDDRDPSYMPRLIAGQTQRDLSWFFDDWLYHDHGLPNFKVESAFARSASPNLFVLTITLENSGTAGAEVPVRVRMAKGETVKRIEVRAKSKTTVRVETPAVPQEIVVNDGSVPESETKDNVFRIAPPQS